MLGKFFSRKDKPDEAIKKERDKHLQNMLDKSKKLKVLIGKEKGWQEFCSIIEDYIDKVKKRKAITALDIASDAEIYQLKLLDHEIYILSWVLKIPEQYINKTENLIKKENEDE